MFRIIGSFLAVAGLALSVSQTANAHGNAYRGHDSSAYHYGVYYRSHSMPRWLRKQSQFRHWYSRTPLRFNQRLRWQELHNAYSWQARNRSRAFYGARYKGPNRDYYRDDRRKRNSKKRRRARHDD